MVIRSAFAIGAALFCTSPLIAQTAGAVLPRGAIGLDIGAMYSHSEARFTSAGTEPFGGWYRDLVGAAAAAAAAELESELVSFFGTTEGDPVTISPTTVAAGDPSARLMGTTRHVPIRLAIGILPRTELSFMLPLDRDELLVQAVGFTGGTLGRNPDPAANAALLESMGEEWGALGASLLLPRVDSPVGVELNRRVEAATGSTLALPDEALDAEFLQELLTERSDIAQPVGGLRPWRIGDLELGARVMALSTFGGAAFPAQESGTIDYRVNVSAAVRLPTGSEVEDQDVFTQLPAIGNTGFRFGADADLFVGRRFWTSTAVSVLGLRPRSERPEPTDALTVVAWSPASETALHLSPRYRLTESISMGARYELARSGSSSEQWIGPEDTGFVVTTPSGMVQRAGVELRFTTFPMVTELSGQLFGGQVAAELALGYLQTFTGPAGVPAARAITFQGRIVQRLWGSGGF